MHITTRLNNSPLRHLFYSNSPQRRVVLRLTMAECWGGELSSGVWRIKEKFELGA
jgi:hypothetical protein